MVRRIIDNTAAGDDDEKQDGRVDKTPAYGSEGLRFDPRQQTFVQLL